MTKAASQIEVSKWHWTRFKAAGAAPRDIIQSFGIYLPPVDVEDIIRMMGIGLEYFDDHTASGAVESSGEAIGSSATIYVHTDDVSYRQRFTMAHELGHLMLHQGKEFRDNFRNQGPKEVEANRFAAALLMPREILLPYAAGKQVHPSRLAKIFQVSEQAMVYRLMRLGFTASR